MGLLDVLEKVSPGVREVRRQVPTHRTWWDEQNESALAAGGMGPWWVALGDSTAQGVGAPAPSQGYVGLVLDHLRRHDPAWRVLNLSVSGATTRDLLDTQLEALAAVEPRLGGPPALVTCGIGINDLVRTPLPRLVADLAELVRRLPADSVVLDVPRGLRPRKAGRANLALRDAAAEHPVQVVDLWTPSGSLGRRGWAADRYHPSVAGYAAWALALEAALGAQLDHG